MPSSTYRRKPPIAEGSAQNVGRALRITYCRLPVVDFDLARRPRPTHPTPDRTLTQTPPLRGALEVGMGGHAAPQVVCFDVVFYFVLFARFLRNQSGRRAERQNASINQNQRPAGFFYCRAVLYL